MSEVTHILAAVERGDPHAAEQLLPLVYDELRKLAAARMAEERAGHTLRPTALVHEAYLRLVGSGPSNDWDSLGHFFAAAAEAMRRILVESARRKIRLKRGGGSAQAEVPDTRQVVARFEAERQALAIMDHPNIAKVLDAGTTAGGLPCFVMELVRGVPITEYCDAISLPPRQRLELFQQVCRAVLHAHQKGSSTATSSPRTSSSPRTTACRW